MQTRKPRPATQSPSTFVDTLTMKTYQATDRIPAQIVAEPGMRFLGWISANRLGNAPRRAIESAERAAGRMVVWVAAVADVSTAIVSRKCKLPRTPLARPPAKMSLGLFARYLVPAYAWEATVTSR